MWAIARAHSDYDSTLHASAFEVAAVLDIARCSGFDGGNDRAASALAGLVVAMLTVLVRGHVGVPKIPLRKGRPCVVVFIVYSLH
ncbi:MAG: hypothetical protein KBG15_24295 [Kofleriaceae bacterium]|nr:hypothetical protein [Kofleriaceae bacterium]